MEWLDWLVVGAYFVLVFGIAVWSSRGPKPSAAVDDYFFAGRHAGWFVIGASLFASNIGAEHLIGLAGTGAASGFAVAQFELLAALILIGLGWFFVPVYLRLGLQTMPEYLERRYSPAARWYLAIVSIIAYVMTKIAVTIAAGGVVFESLMGIDFWWGATLVVASTGIYTVIGGLKAVLYTDMVQMFVLIGGALAVTWIGLDKVGGISALFASTDSHLLSLWRPLSDPAFPWTGILFGAPILGVWYWCTDQFIVQRVLSARNISQAQGGTLFAAFLKLSPMFLFVMPGLIALSLKNSGQIELANFDSALPALVIYLLPAGFKGLVAAGLLAALMSSLSSVFNSCSTLISVDIYKKLKPKASETQMVLVGQVATGVMVILGLAWIPVIKSISGQLYQYLQSVQAYIAPPIAAVFLLGILTPRVTSSGANLALGLGFILGMSRLFLEIWHSTGEVSFSPLLNWFVTLNFLHFALFLFIVSVLVCFVWSKSSEVQLKGGHVQGSTDLSLILHQDEKTKARLFLLVGLLVLCVGGIWVVFSPLVLG